MRYFRVARFNTPPFVVRESAEPVTLDDDPADNYYTEPEMLADSELAAALERWRSGEESLRAEHEAREAIREWYDPVSSWVPATWTGLSWPRGRDEGNDLRELFAAHSDSAVCALALELDAAITELGAKVQRAAEAWPPAARWIGPDPTSEAQATLVS